jgi:HSP20 family molecular chaperone IbpA
MADEKRELQKKEAQSSVETERTKSRRVYVPKVDIYEAKDAIVLVADMPGVDEKSVDITLDKNILTIAGTVEPEAYKDHSITYSEYDTGDYERAFTISDEVDRNKIEASVKQGVLRVTLPKVEPVKAKKIAIKTG